MERQHKQKKSFTGLRKYTAEPNEGKLLKNIFSIAVWERNHVDYEECEKYS